MEQSSTERRWEPEIKKRGVMSPRFADRAAVVSLPAWPRLGARRARLSRARLHAVTTTRRLDRVASRPAIDRVARTRELARVAP